MCRPRFRMANRKKVEATKKAEVKTVMANLADEYKERRGAIWEKDTKDKKRKFLSILIDKNSYLGFLNLKPTSERSPKYWIQKQDQKSGERTQVGGIWPGMSRSGKTEMLWIQLPDLRFIALPNPFDDGTKENQPKYLVFLAYSQKNQEAKERLLTACDTSDLDLQTQRKKVASTKKKVKK